MTDWSSILPITQDHEDVSDENDWWFDDGSVSILMTIEGDRAVLHDVYANERALQGRRTGIGRAALRRLRPYFTEIVASGVGEPGTPGSKGTKPDYGEQPAFRFWRAMMREGLVDRISFMICGTEITKDDLSAPVVTGFCTIEPDQQDMVAFSPGH